MELRNVSGDDKGATNKLNSIEKEDVPKRIWLAAWNDTNRALTRVSCLAACCACASGSSEAHLMVQSAGKPASGATSALTDRVHPKQIQPSFPHLEKPKMLTSSEVLLTPADPRKVTGVHVLPLGRGLQVFLKYVPIVGAQTELHCIQATNPTEWRLSTEYAIYRFGPRGGGTPSALKIRDAWYVWFREDRAGTQDVSLLVSRDRKKWDYTSRVFRANTEGWDSRIIAGVHVIQVGDLLYMYYRGSAYKNQMQSDIGLAVSVDGVHWERFSSEPIFTRSASGWDSALLADPHVMKIEDRYYMLYSGHDNRSLTKSRTTDEVGLGKKVGLAVSNDGIRWQRCFDRPIIECGLKADNPFALYQDGKLEVWFRTTDHPQGEGGRIVYRQFAINL